MAIQIINRQKKISLDLKSVRRSLIRILKELNCSDRELNILFTDDAGIRLINHEYLGKDRPTNVISFGMAEREGWEVADENILGDIVISVETAQRDGEQGGLTLEHEIDFLMIHGVLHLLGFDHIRSRTEANKMAVKERDLFQRLNGFALE